MQTPWGKADSVTVYAEGIAFYSTPSHGGFQVAPQLVSEIPKPLRGLSGYPETWYEEDCAWSVVAYVFPSAFLERMSDVTDEALTDAENAARIKTHARGVLERWYPEELATAEYEDAIHRDPARAVERLRYHNGAQLNLQV